MKRFHHVTISAFVAEESLEFLDTLLPIPAATFLAEQYTRDPDRARTKIYSLHKAKLIVQKPEGEGLTQVSFIFNKISDTNKLFNNIYASLSEEDKTFLKEHAEERTNDYGKLVLRLDRTAFEKGNYELTVGGLAISCSFLLAVFPKNEKTIKESLQRLFI